MINMRISGRRDSVANEITRAEYYTKCMRFVVTEERKQNKPEELNAGEKEFSTNSRFGREEMKQIL